MNVRGTWKIQIVVGGKKSTDEHKGSQTSLGRHLGDLLVLYPQAQLTVDPVQVRLSP